MYNPTDPIQSSVYSSTQTPPRRTFPKINLKLPVKPLGILATTAILYILTVLASTVLSNFSENISQAGVTTLFDPLITIAYILVFYSVSHYYSLTKSQAYNYLLLALFLSFTINFVEGSMILVALAPILRKLKLIESPTQL